VVVIDIKNFKKRLVTGVELSFGNLPFVFTYGIIEAYCKKWKISLNTFLIGLGENSGDFIPFLYFALQKGFEYSSIENPLTFDDFQVFLQVQDITKLMEEFTKSLPQDESEAVEGEEKNVVSQ